MFTLNFQEELFIIHRETFLSTEQLMAMCQISLLKQYDAQWSFSWDCAFLWRLSWPKGQIRFIFNVEEIMEQEKCNNIMYLG